MPGNAKKLGYLMTSELREPMTIKDFNSCSYPAGIFLLKVNIKNIRLDQGVKYVH